MTIFRVWSSTCHSPCIYKGCGTYLTKQLSKMGLYFHRKVNIPMNARLSLYEYLVIVFYK